MGSYFGARLVLAGHEVTLIDPDDAQIAAVRRSGLTLIDGAGARAGIAATAVVHPIDAPAADLVIVLTKANRLSEALAASEHLTQTATTLILCNGLGCVDVANELVPASGLLYGATAAGAVIDEPGVVRKTFEGQTRFGSLLVPLPERATEVARLLSDAGLAAEATDRVDDWIWSKLLVNIGYNAATALARVTNGALVQNTSGRAVLQAAVGEAMAVAVAKEITLAYDDPIAYVVGLGLGPIGQNNSSMLQDVLRGRQTEIEFLNAAVSREGRAVGVATPVNDTLTGLVRSLDQHLV